MNYQQQQGGPRPPAQNLDPVTAQERLDLMMLAGLVNTESQTINRLASVDSSSSRLFVPPVGKEMVLNHLTDAPPPQSPQPQPQRPQDVPPIVAGSGGVAIDATVQSSVANSLRTIATQLEILNQTIQSLIVKR